MENEYDKQAEDFLKETETTFKAEFLKNGIHFQDDKDSRDIYLITLKRGDREYTFNFGNSINNSIKYRIVQGYLTNELKEKIIQKGLNIVGVNTLEDLNRLKPFFIGMGNFWDLNDEFKEPSAYDVLAGLTGYDTGTFEEFCSSYGYESDSIKAKKTYEAVVEEFKNVKMLFDDKEIEKLQEIN